MESLKLTFPSLQPGQEFILETDPKATREWLGNLAYVDINHTINEMTRVVKTLNRSPQKLSHREKNFNLISRGYLTLSRHMREQHDLHKSYVEKDQYTALHDLSTEIAFGFKRIIENISSTKVLVRKSQRLANAINHAQHYLGLMLIEQYQLYSPIPSYLWRELHLLYEYAEKNKLTQLVLSKEEPLALAPSRTIELSYIRNCLMSVVNPYHIEDNQHWHLFKYLAHWSKEASITKDLYEYSKERCFIIDLADANQPHIATDASDYQDEKQIRLLLTDKLLSTIKQQMDTFEKKKVLPKPGFYHGIEPSNGYKLLKRIYDFCDKFMQRNSRRYPLVTHVDTIWGLSFLKRVLLQEAEMQKPVDVDQELPVLLGNKYPTQIRWDSINHSEGGTCLRNYDQQVDDLRVGNLVILKRYINQKAQKNWQLAIVRWLQGGKKKGATVGLEYIHGDLKFIKYLTKDKNSNLIEHPVVYIEPFDSTSPLLISAKNLIGKQKIIQLEIDDVECEARLNYMIETNSKITIYEVGLENSEL